MRRLRIARVIVQPVLVWDDGDELTDGPIIDPVQLPLSAVPGFIDSLPEQVAGIADQVSESPNARPGGAS